MKDPHYRGKKVHIEFISRGYPELARENIKFVTHVKDVDGYICEYSDLVLIRDEGVYFPIDARDGAIVSVFVRGEKIKQIFRQFCTDDEEAIVEDNQYD